MQQTVFDRKTMSRVISEVSTDFGISREEAELRIQDVLEHGSASLHHRQVGPYAGAAARRVWERMKRVFEVVEEEVSLTVEEHVRQSMLQFEGVSEVFAGHPDLVELDALLERLHG